MTSSHLDHLCKAYLQIRPRSWVLGIRVSLGGGHNSPHNSVDDRVMVTGVMERTVMREMTVIVMVIRGLSPGPPNVQELLREQWFSGAQGHVLCSEELGQSIQLQEQSNEKDGPRTSLPP